MSQDLRLISSSQIAELAGLRSAATISNWRSRPGLDFPAPKQTIDRRPMFDSEEVVEWLQNRDPERYAHVATAVRRLWVVQGWNAALEYQVSPLDFQQIVLTLLALRKGADEHPSLSTAWEAAPRTTEGFIALVEEGCRTLPEEAGMPTGDEATSFFPVQDSPALLDSWGSGAFLSILMDGAQATPIDRLTDAEDAALQVVERAALRRVIETGTASSPIAQLVGSLVTGEVPPADTSDVRRLLPIAQILRALEIEPVSQGIVYDPACGIGQSLVNTCTEAPSLKVVGSDIDPYAVRTIRQRFFIRGLNGQFAVQNAEVSDPAPGVRAQRIMVEPPFGLRITQVPASDPRWVLDVMPRGPLSEALWIQDALAHLAADGLAFLTLTRNVLASSIAKDLRLKLLTHGHVRAVIGLPSNLLAGTSVATCVLVLQPQQTTMQDVRFVDVVDTPHGDAREVQVADVPLMKVLQNDAQNLSPQVWTGSIDLNADTAAAHLRESSMHLQGKLDAIAVAWNPKLAAQDFSDAQITTVGDMLSNGQLVLVRGTMDRGASKDSPVAFSRKVLRARGLPDEQVTDTDPDATQPGDVVFSVEDRIRATVDTLGGHLVANGLQVLRNTGDSIDSAYLAACMEGAWNERFASGAALRRVDVKQVEIPMIQVDSQRRVAEVLRDLAATRRSAVAAADAAQAVENSLLTAVYARADLSGKH